jgi:mono/diheme cytochrome c family protein
MRRLILWIAGLLALIVILGLAIRGRGISTTRAPLPGEQRLAKGAWRFMIPAASRDAGNPVPNTPQVLEHALEHFADHCAICHGNDGRGDTMIGRRLFPAAPDMRAAGTQGLTDGELFYAIEKGIPWTAMPGWSDGTEEGAKESWELVRFIRHLPDLTAAELKRMEALNPRSPGEGRHDDKADAEKAPAKTPGHHK